VCGVNWNLAILEGIAIQVLDDRNMLILSELVQSPTCIAVHLRAGTDTKEKNERLPRFQESAGICKFTFRLVRNDGPAQRVVVIANRIHAESDHIDHIATKSESLIRIQLKHPTSGDLATNYIFSFSGEQHFFSAVFLGFRV
jgi:hypothetical protein